MHETTSAQRLLDDSTRAKAENGLPGCKARRCPRLAETLDAQPDCRQITKYWPLSLGQSVSSPANSLRELRALDFTDYEIGAACTLEHRTSTQLLTTVTGPESSFLFFSRRDLTQ